jgi:ParB-like chromosome segregation protein Spo0J
METANDFEEKNIISIDAAEFSVEHGNAVSAKQFEFHNAAKVFPMLDADELAALATDILENGQREPITLFEGKILDGRNRYLACLQAGVEPLFTEYKGRHPIDFVISLNLKRRHLDESQRAMVAAKLANLSDGQRADRVASSIDLPTAAKLLNVSESSIKRAQTVQREADPEIVRAVESGEVSVSAAAQFAKLPKEEQAEQVERAASPADAIKAAKSSRRRQMPNNNQTALDAAEISNLANGLLVALSGIAPILQRLEEMGCGGFWQQIGPPSFRLKLFRGLLNAHQTFDFLRDLYIKRQNRGVPSLLEQDRANEPDTSAAIDPPTRAKAEVASADEA